MAAAAAQRACPSASAAAAALQCTLRWQRFRSAPSPGLAVLQTQLATLHGTVRDKSLQHNASITMARVNAKQGPEKLVPISMWQATARLHYSLKQAYHTHRSRLAIPTT